MVVARGKKRGSLYIAEASADGVNAVSSYQSQTKLWHQRSRHISEKGMNMLVTSGKLPKLKKVE